MIKTAIVGATGYTGVELMRILSMHPGARLETVTSRTEAGRNVPELFPSLRGTVDLTFVDPASADLSGCDLVFFATPNGTAMQQAPELLTSGTRIIDLSADFRLKDVIEWQTWYGLEHRCPDLVAEAVYGLPELNRQAIKDARLVANPGCYPTAVILGFAPLLEQNLVEPGTLIADAKSGVSGAGRKESINLLYGEVSESFNAYATGGHRHLPEIRQILNSLGDGDNDLVFVPHLVPMIRGIHATLYASLKDISVDLTEMYLNRFRGEPFVDVMPAGSQPKTGDVRGTNTCRIACHRPQDGNTAVILAVEDNLVKGAAGQAVQNMNIMFGLEETSGLDSAGSFP